MYDMLMSVSDLVGIIGVILLLIAYFALSTGKVVADSLLYQLLNFMAAWLILFSLYFHWNTPSVLIEIAWIIISVIGMSRIFLNKFKQNMTSLES